MLSTAVASLVCISSAKAELFTGLGAGYAHMEGKEKVTMGGLTSPNQLGFNRTQKSHLNSNGAQYFALIGYDHFITDKIFIGIEASVGIVDTKAKKTDLIVFGRGKRTLKSSDFFTVTERFGIKIAEKTKLYAKVGLSNTHFKFKVTDDYDENDIISKKSNKRLNGVTFGGGVEQGINDRFAVRVEVMHVNFDSIKAKTALPDSAVTTAHKVKPQSTIASAALIIKI